MLDQLEQRVSLYYRASIQLIYLGIRRKGYNTSTSSIEAGNKYDYKCQSALSSPRQVLLHGLRSKYINLADISSPKKADSNKAVSAKQEKKAKNISAKADK